MVVELAAGEEVREAVVRDVGGAEIGHALLADDGPDESWGNDEAADPERGREAYKPSTRRGETRQPRTCVCEQATASLM